MEPTARATSVRPSNAILIAASALVVHLIDDNVVQAEWGGPLDHVVSTLVPIVMIGALMVGLSRGRPGARALSMVVLGIVGLMVASEAIYSVTASTVTGDDWTGLVSGVAGCFLVAVGVRDLWRSRHRGGSRWRIVARRGARGAAALAATAFVVFPVVESYAITNASVTEVPGAHLGAAHEEVSFTTSDGLRLRGWYVPSTNGASIIVFPGRTHAQRQARMLVEHGYGVLLVDRRGTGESDGEPNGYGWDAQRDIHAAVEFLQARDDVDDDRIGGLGLSVGGELMLQAAAESDGLRAVVSEGAGIRSVKELRGIGGVESWLARPVLAVTTLSTAVFSNQMPPASLHELVGRIEVPVFLIYASRGHGGEMLSEQYYDLARGPKELWEVDATHMGGFEAEPDEYERRVVGFFDEALFG